MLRRVLLAGLILSALALSGCLFVRAPSTGVIEGYVTDCRAGAPVAGAVVRAWPLDGEAPRYTVISDYYGATAVTNAEGYYRLVVPEGLYVVEVRKDGYGTSRVEGVKVASTARVDIVQFPAGSPTWSLTPPTVTITGIKEGDTISGPVTVRIDARGPNDILYIYAAFGKTPGASLLTAPRVNYSNTYTTGQFSINPADYGVAGATTFEVVVYDWNYNRTHVIYRVYVTPGADGSVSAPQPPTANILSDAAFGVLIPPRVALAVTLSKQVGFFGLEPEAAPPGGNVYVELRWNKSPDDTATRTGDGYRIYRKLATETEYRLLYTVNATGAASYLYRDSSPDLRVGLRADYRITYFCGSAESDPLEASATPLPMWDVRLVSPANEASGVSLYPTFVWEPTTTVGTTQFYQMVFWDMGHGPANGILISTLNQTSATFTGLPGTRFERLIPYRMYHWAMRAALGIDLNLNAVSIAVNDGYTTIFPTVKPTEMWIFTTGDW
jgi:hypothetical protein